ncbi:hypothetical protein QR90_05030 [Deinococcus radiopugnans]|uniref:DEAD/DEAH box helicase n=1 Tax=Deinococcus radiopugnans TaxID=57497 RepID=A0A0A7KEJ4_9DEIO|nr:DEAD/DEAH box helicase [Deinococcus radiopugnans]AIZ44592.1 hypothetical protein QR90_05030 [Deinococcus radiopugnans]
MSRIYAGHSQTVSTIPAGLFDQLQVLLEDRDDVIAIIEVVSQGPATRQVDCAILSPGGIDVIEIKNKRNRVVGSASGAWETDDGGRLNAFSNTKGDGVENPYEQAVNTARDMEKWMGQRRGSRKITAYPLVLIPHAAPGCNISRHNWAWLALGLDQLERQLRALRSHKRIWEPQDYHGLPAELGLIPIDMAEVRGQTLDRATGKGLRHVQVNVSGLRAPLTVDTRGHFSFTFRPGSSLTLQLIPSTLHASMERVIQTREGDRLIELGELFLEPVVSPEHTAQTEQEVAGLHARMEQLQKEHAAEVQRLLEKAHQAGKTAEDRVQRALRHQKSEAQELERLKQQQAEDALHLVTLREQLAAADAGLAALDRGRPEDQDRITQLQADRDQHAAEVSALEKIKARKEKEARAATKRAEEIARQLQQSQDELDGHRDHIQALEKDNRRQQQDLETLKTEHDRVLEELTQVTLQTQGVETERTAWMTFARKAEAAAKGLTTWKERAQQAQAVLRQQEQALAAAQKAGQTAAQREREQARQEQERQQALFEVRESELQEQLETAMTRLATLSQHTPAGQVLARAASWRQRGNEGRSPLARIALDRLRSGEVAPGTSLPDRIGPDPDPKVWDLPPPELLGEMQRLTREMTHELHLLTPPEQAVKRSFLERLQDATEDLEDAAETGDPGDDDLQDALTQARRLMALLAPAGPSQRPQVKEPAQAKPVRFTGNHHPGPNARAWVLHGGLLRDLITGEHAELLIPGVGTSPLPAELDGLTGLRDRGVFVPIWRLPEERQIEAWLPGNWSASLVSTETGEPEPLIDRATDLLPLQFQVLTSSLPLDLLLEWTGERLPAPLLPTLHDAVLNQLTRDLQDRGITPSRAEVEASQVERSLQFDYLETILAPDIAAARDGTSVPIAGLGLDTRVDQALPARVQKSGLYLHQALSLHLIRAAHDGGPDVILSTPTASGKTMAFLPGVLEGVLQQGGNALFLYPLRALASDQLRTLEGVLKAMEEDAPLLGRMFGGEKVDLDRGTPRLIVGTPDQVNHGLDQDWVRQFLQGLRYVVLDEAHTYRGPFGSHMSGFLRRLLALCPVPPTLILSSATLQNTISFAHLLTGRRAFRVAGASTAPRYPRHLYVAPPRTGEPHRAHLGSLRSFGEVIRARKSKGLVFAGSRNASKEIARELTQPGDHMAAPTVFPFFSGMLNYDSELTRLRDTGADGRRQALIAASTSTLEAGVDIGDLDMVTVVGFPRSRNSFKQMVGRAGRVGTAHIIFLPGSTPADEYYSHPAALHSLLARESEPVYLNPHNPILAAPHVERARHEAACAGHHTDARLLDRLYPEGLHADDRAALLPLFDLPVHRVRAPQLRGNGTLPHIVVIVGKENGPHSDAVHLTLPEEGGDWLLERLNPEAAYREWPREGRATHGSRYYRVVSWRKGTLKEKPGDYAQTVVVIGIEDITEQTLRPEEVLTYMVRPSGEQTLPPGHYAPRTRARKVRPGATPVHLGEAQAIGPVQVEVGVGEVSFQETGDRLGELVSRARCEQALRRFSLPKLRRGQAVAVEVLAGGQVRHHAWQTATLAPWASQLVWGRPAGNPLWSTYTLPEGMTSTVPGLLTAPPQEARGRSRPLPDAASGRAVPVLQVSLHEHHLHVEETCSCGAATRLSPFWQDTWTSVREDVPLLPDDGRRWSAHDLASHTFRTDMARVQLSGGDEAVRRTLMLAMVKAIPDLLEVDPQEFAVGVTDCALEGELEYLVWDTTPGGTGIARALEHTLAALLAAAAELLERSRRCSCEGEGCYGCVLPLERIQNLILESADDPEESQRLQELSYSGFAKELDVQGALRLCELTPAQQAMVKA